MKEIMLPTHAEMLAKWMFFVQPVDKQRDKDTFEQFHTKATEIKTVIKSICIPEIYKTESMWLNVLCSLLLYPKFITYSQ